MCCALESHGLTVVVYLCIHVYVQSWIDSVLMHMIGWVDGDLGWQWHVYVQLVGLTVTCVCTFFLLASHVLIPSCICTVGWVDSGSPTKRPPANTGETRPHPPSTETGTSVPYRWSPSQHHRQCHSGGEPFSWYLISLSLSFHHLFKLTGTMHGSNLTSLKGRLYKLDNLHTV